MFMLIIPAATIDAALPYKFKATGINVFSLEEALYHCFHYWKQSIDDFACEDFAEWVKVGLGLSFISSKIRELNKVAGFTERFIQFLSITDYFDFEDTEGIRGELLEWENRMEWEKLKERADYLMNRDEPVKAFALYKKALTYTESTALLNNAGIALMRQGDFVGAIEYLKRAECLEPDNINIILHLAEAYVYAGDGAAARYYIGIAEAQGVCADVCFLRGELAERDGDFAAAAELYQQASAVDANPHYTHKLADALVRMRRFEAAVLLMESSPVKDKGFLRKLAELHAENNNLPAAIRCIEQALDTEKSNANLWTRLAAYHLANYDHDKAYTAVTRAISIDKDNPRVNLEFARVRKAQGRIKEYQVILKKVLGGLKDEYRENMDCEI
ncbi:MAG: tetratricopeptide repeat protein [Defluviitaleaceae bacterium]|nr:tetratricopeptide repeat protein [Defluviitaleaceae bacterium]